MHSRSQIAGLLLLLGLCSITRARDWPQWRGPNRDGVAPSAPALNTLSKDLRPAWKINVGTGFSSPVVANDALYYADEQDHHEVLHRIHALTGKEVWKAEIAESAGDEWGTGPRSTPFVDGDRVYFQSISGEFRCLSAADGKQSWGASFKSYGAEFLRGKAGEGTATRRGNNGCGIVEGNWVYLPVGARGASVVCFEKLSGKEVWKTLSDEAAYSSFVVAKLAGLRQLVAFTADALVGLDLISGKQLWRVPYRTGAKRHASTPLIDGDTVTVSSQSIGLVRVKIANEADGFTATEVWRNKPLTINLASSVQVDGFLYTFGAIRTKDYVCVDAATGITKWSQPGFGMGKDQTDYASTIVVGKNLLVLTYDGQLVLVAGNPEKYTELGRVQVCGKTWSHPAFANGWLFVRDGRELQAFDLAGKPKS